ncbi:MAG TPA: vanadium-dependent haloperoxidase [Casimicrobiaceae bacterium]
MNQLRSILITSTVVLLGVPQITNADVVTDWNTIAVSTVSADAVVNRQSRDMAMVQAAMFDAMNAIRPYYTPAMVSITAKGYASRDAAAAQAAHDVLLALFPAQQTNLDAKLAASLAQISDDYGHGHRPKYEGIVTGQAAALAVLNARQNDHAFDRVVFTPLTGTGEYRFTPGCSATNISVPGWGNVTPFTVSDPDYFPTSTRPPISDPEWLASLDEVRAYGASDSTVRTAEQLEIGLFYIEPSLPSMNRLARQLIAQEPVETNRAAASKQLLAHARLFAALNIAQADTYIRTWRVKYREHFWRPFTAINFLYPGTNWMPARQTPCHPEFYAAHGTLTPAAITAIQNYRGSDTIDVTTISASLPGAKRYYTSLDQIIEDVNAARIYTGFHYRSTLVRSNALGVAVANWIDDNMMTVLPESAVGPNDQDNDGYDVGI